MDLQPVAVEFDFVDPLVTTGCFGFQRGELGTDESPHGRRKRGAFDHRAMKRVWLRFTITHSTKRQHNTEKGRRIQISNARIFQPFLSRLADITQWYQGFL
jgi:hypothetical protein